MKAISQFEFIPLLLPISERNMLTISVKSQKAKQVLQLFLVGEQHVPVPCESVAALASIAPKILLGSPHDGQHRRFGAYLLSTAQRPFQSEIDSYMFGTSIRVMMESTEATKRHMSCPDAIGCLRCHRSHPLLNACCKGLMSDWCEVNRPDQRSNPRMRQGNTWPIEVRPFLFGRPAPLPSNTIHVRQ